MEKFSWLQAVTVWSPKGESVTDLPSLENIFNNHRSVLFGLHAFTLLCTRSRWSHFNKNSRQQRVNSLTSVTFVMMWRTFSFWKTLFWPFVLLFLDQTGWHETKGHWLESNVRLLQTLYVGHLLYQPSYLKYFHQKRHICISFVKSYKRRHNTAKVKQWSKTKRQHTWCACMCTWPHV